ncbi:hypothetical protein [Actinoplanes subtropicus]|uniref:hypothetical protein n=1 Tax=Actinoplanes subtropicus TaxID=543632 RepID=UPI0012F8861A|nr:hypothetical protein [Actinoplanes subtropicus]
MRLSAIASGRQGRFRFTLVLVDWQGARSATVEVFASLRVVSGAIVGHAGDVPKPVTRRSAPTLTVRVNVQLVGGSAGRAVAAAQGRALRSLLATICTGETADQNDINGSTQDTVRQTGDID